MPYVLELPHPAKSAGWKVKIREKERLEPPHVTVMHRTREWRIGLRDRRFLIPPGGRWRDLDPEVRDAIREGWCELRAAWDAKYPSNPIGVDPDEQS